MLNKKLTNLCDTNQPLFTCFRKSRKFIETFKKEFLAEIYTNNKNLNKQKAFWFTDGSRKFYIEKFNLEKVEALKERTCLNITDSTKKMAQLIQESKELVFDAFNEFFMFDSNTKSVLLLIGETDITKTATEILLQVINTNMYYQINQVFSGRSETVNISYVTFTENLGEILIMFVIQNKIFNKLSSTNAKLEYLQTCAPYLQNLCKDLKYEEKNIENIFCNTFDIRPTFINTNVINLLHIYILYNFLSEFLKNKNKNTTNFDVSIKFLTIIYTNLSNNEKEDIFKRIRKERFRLKSILKEHFILLGIEMVKPLLYNEKFFILRSKQLKGVMKERTEILLKQPFLTLTMTSSLPIITKIPYRNENNKKTDNLADNINFVIKARAKQLIHEKYYLTAIAHNESIFRQQNNITKFKINRIFTLEFFSLLSEIINTAALNDNENTLLCNVLNEKAFLFLLELYNIDFKTLCNRHIKLPLMNKILIYALDFNNLEKFKINTSCLPPRYDVFFKDLLKKIYSYKIIFSELFCHVDIMRHFKQFQYDIFIDTRNRKYDEASALNPQGFPLARCFLSFSNNLSLKELMQISKLKDNADIYNLKDKILHYLKNQLASVMNVEKIDALSNMTLIDWFDNLKTLGIKKNAAFHSFTWFYDYYHLKNDSTNTYKPISHYSLDSSTSGIQLTSIIQKNKNLAISCNVCDPNQSQIHQLKNTIMSLKNQQEDLRTSITNIVSKNKNNFNTLIEYHNAINESAVLFNKITTINNHILELENIRTQPNTVDLNTLFTQYLKSFLNTMRDIASIDFAGKNFIINVIVNKPEFSENKKFAYYHRIINILQKKFKHKSLDFTGFSENDIETFLEYKYLLSKTFLEKAIPETLDNESLFTKKYIMAFLILENILDIDNLLVTHSIIETFILSRKIAKILNMTIPYGSTLFGRRKQFKTQFIKYCLIEGIIYKKEDLEILNIVSAFIDKIFIVWLKNTMPQTLTLYKITQRLTTTKKWENFTIKSPFFEYTYYPEKLINKKLSTGLKKKNMIRTIVMKSSQPNVLDYKKIKNSFVANLIQFCDATLCCIFFDILQKTYPNIKISAFSIFDRFFIDPLLSFMLKDVLLLAYKGLYNLNLLENNFSYKKFPSFYEELQWISISNELDELKEAIILIKNQQKHLKNIAKNKSLPGYHNARNQRAALNDTISIINNHMQKLKKDTLIKPKLNINAQLQEYDINHYHIAKH